MKKKIIGIFVCMLLITTIMPITAIAGDEENPEIVDESDDTLFSCLDIISAWFSDDDESLCVSIKVVTLKIIPFIGSTVIWGYKGTDYFASMQGGKYYFGDDKGKLIPWRYKDTTGSCNKETGIITIRVPMSEIDNPQQGEQLTNTWAMTHWSGFLGLNFHVPFDRAPEWGTWGKDYAIQN